MPYLRDCPTCHTNAAVTLRTVSITASAAGAADLTSTWHHVCCSTCETRSIASLSQKRAMLFWNAGQFQYSTEGCNHV